METPESFFNRRAKQSNTAATSQTFTRMVVVWTVMETLESFFDRRAKQSNIAATSQTFTRMVVVRYRLRRR